MGRTEPQPVEADRPLNTNRLTISVAKMTAADNMANAPSPTRNPKPRSAASDPASWPIWMASSPQAHTQAAGSFSRAASTAQMAQSTK